MNKDVTDKGVSNKDIVDGYLSKHGYVIKKELLNEDQLLKLKTELRAKPLVDSKFTIGKPQDVTFPVYIETKNKIYIPKMFGIKKYGFPKSVLQNFEGKEWETEIEFAGQLYANQHEPADKLINSCKKNGGGILSLQTGGGKTISTLYVLSQLKGKTIIVVNKIPLMKQWENEISRFLPNARIGIIQGQNNVDTANKDIVIAMLQSLARIDYPKSLFEEFSVCVIDEIHNLGSQMFSKVLFKLCSKYTIGLSATPKRSDGCDYVFKWHIGEIVYESKSDRKGKCPIVKLLKIDSSDYKEINTINKFTGQKQIQFTSMLSELIEMPKRNKLILELIKENAKLNRRILVLSDRRSHLVYLKKQLDEDLSLTFTYGLFLGSMKASELERSKSSQVILATFQAFGEGVSEKDLDTLILVTPKKFTGHLKNTVKNESGKLEQIVGRIFRKEHISKHPLIIDLQDNFSVYKNQSAQRKVFYKQHFQELILEDEIVNLDNHLIENINLNCIEIKKRKGNKVINKITSNSIDNRENSSIHNNEKNQVITTFCFLDD